MNFISILPWICQVDIKILAAEEGDERCPLNGNMSPSSLMDQSSSNCLFDLSNSHLSNLRESDIPWMVIGPRVDLVLFSQTGHGNGISMNH